MSAENAVGRLRTLNEAKSPMFKVGITAKIQHGILLECLEVLKWTQKDAADFLGISYGYFNLIYNLKRVPSFEGPRGKVLKEKFEELTHERVEIFFPNPVYSKEFLETPKTSRIIKKISAALLTKGKIMTTLPSLSKEDLIAESEDQTVALALRILDTLLSRLTEEHAIECVEKLYGMRIKEKRLQAPRSKILAIAI